MTPCTGSGSEGGRARYIRGQTGAISGGNIPQNIVSGIHGSEEEPRLLGSNESHGNIVGIRTWEEPTKDPGALLERSYGGCKGRGVLWPPV